MEEEVLKVNGNMRKFFLIPLLIITIAFVIIYGVRFFLKKSIIGQLNEKNQKIEMIWMNIYSSSYNRLLHLERLNGIAKSKCTSDSLTFYIVENKKTRNIKDVENLWFLEYNTNKQFLQIKPCYEAELSTASILLSLKDNASKLNKIVSDYNSLVREYNLYYSTFPNFLFAKGSGHKRKKYFELSFGMDNEKVYSDKMSLKKWIMTGE